MEIDLQNERTISRMSRRLLEPPMSLQHCGCPICATCEGRISWHQDCRHGELDYDCSCDYCDCGRALSEYEKWGTHDTCAVCFEGINKDKFGDKPYAEF